MRRKPIEERRRFVGVVAISVMAIITAAWFIFFFTGFTKQLSDSKKAPSAEAAASVVTSFGGLQEPFSKPFGN